MLNVLSSNKHKDKYIIGTGLNSLSETINFNENCNVIKFLKGF